MTGKSLQTWVIAGLAFSLLAVSDGAGQSRKKTADPGQLAASGATRPAGQIEEEDYAVYSALTDELYASRGGTLLVIDKDVSGCAGTGNNVEGEKARQQELNKLTTKMPGLSARTIADFKKKEMQCRYFESRFSLRTKYVLIDKQERNSIFFKQNVKKAWENFFRKYPGASGYINFSNVGFNEDHTQALVNTYRKCGGSCGAEQMVLLTKANGKWAVTSTLKIWEL